MENFKSIGSNGTNRQLKCVTFLFSQQFERYIENMPRNVISAKLFM
jgi:hypothetical protein